MIKLVELIGDRFIQYKGEKDEHDDINEARKVTKIFKPKQGENDPVCTDVLVQTPLGYNVHKGCGNPLNYHVDGAEERIQEDDLKVTHAYLQRVEGHNYLLILIVLMEDEDILTIGTALHYDADMLLGFLHTNPFGIEDLHKEDKEYLNSLIQEYCPRYGNIHIPKEDEYMDYLWQYIDYLKTNN